MAFQFSRPVTANLANSAKVLVTPASTAARSDAQPANPLDDDRVRCTDCSWLSMSGVCRAAGPKHKPVVASRGYQPVRDLPRRCEGFSPYGNNPDQRRGFERWPGLAAFHFNNATPPGVSHLSVGGNHSGDSK
jgi:hypothetical protein